MRGILFPRTPRAPAESSHCAGRPEVIIQAHAAGPLHKNILRTGQPKARHIGQACQGVLSRLDMAFVHLRTLPSRDWQSRLTTVSTLILTTTKQAGRSCQGCQGRMLCQFHVASCWLGAPQHHTVSSTSLSRLLGAQLIGM